MSVTSNRVIGLSFQGDVNAPNLAYEAAENSNSPGSIVTESLSSGANTITKPTGARAVTILPPAANIVVLTLKGVGGDTGIILHLTDPTSIGLGTSVTTFVLDASDNVDVRLIWS